MRGLEYIKQSRHKNGGVPLPLRERLGEGQDVKRKPTPLLQKPRIYEGVSPGFCFLPLKGGGT
jgi:hypothetical protein